MKFAKLFDLENSEQVLLSCRYNDDDDKYEITIRTDFDGATAEVVLGFQDEAKALKTIEDYTKEKAIIFRNEMYEMFDQSN